MAEDEVKGRYELLFALKAREEHIFVETVTWNKPHFLQHFRYRMGLRPRRDENTKLLQSKAKPGTKFQAVTEYKVWYQYWRVALSPEQVVYDILLLIREIWCDYISYFSDFSTQHQIKILIFLSLILFLEKKWRFYIWQFMIY